jgi:hypothetical protein
MIDSTTPSSTAERKPPPFVAWPLLLGAAGFTAGFFGPIAFLPDANTGPMIGIFLTGPGGVVLGVVLGVVSRAIGWPAATAWKWLIGTATAGFLAIITFCILAPTPIPRGAVIEGAISRCIAPMELAPEAIAYWEGRIAKTTWAPARAGWKDEVPSMLDESKGVVLEITVARENPVFEQRKLWNKGTLRLEGWRTPANPVKRVYARHNGKQCADYSSGKQAQYYPIDEPSPDWPPKTAPSFLGLHLLQAVPDRLKPSP